MTYPPPPHRQWIEIEVTTNAVATTRTNTGTRSKQLQPVLQPLFRSQLVTPLNPPSPPRPCHTKGGGDADDNTRGDDAGRILFVMTSFDRGRRLGPSFKKDKLDFILLMMDEMREACEVADSLPC